METVLYNVIKTYENATYLNIFLFYFSRRIYIFMNYKGQLAMSKISKNKQYFLTSWTLSRIWRSVSELVFLGVCFVWECVRRIRLAHVVFGGTRTRSRSISSTFRNNDDVFLRWSLVCKLKKTQTFIKNFSLFFSGSPILVHTNICSKTLKIYLKIYLEYIIDKP